MGVVQCPRHGLSGITFACRHVREAVLAGRRLPTCARISADLDYQGWRMEATFCAECVQAATADGGGTDRIGEQGLDWFFELPTEPVCSSCLAEAKRA
jgi:hypothetical protein